MELIPAIDLLDGKAVRLLKGNYEAVTVYSHDPVSLAASWRGVAPRLHVVDLDGARAGRAMQRELVRSIVAAFGSGVQVGGGVRTTEACESYLELGADRVVLGTAAVKTPELVESVARAHPNRVVVAIDARDGWVATDGWEKTSGRHAVELAGDFSALPLAAVLYTDIDRDGTEVGPNIRATSALAAGTPLPVIASGGVGTLEHLRALGRAPGPIAGVIVGRALHEGRFSLQQAIRAASGT